MSQTKNLQVVTGGTSGMGLATAKALSVFGPVLIGGRNQKRLDAALAELKEAGVEAYGMQCDIADKESLNKFVEYALTLGKIDHVVNAAAVDVGGPDLIFNINILGTINVTEAFLPYMDHSVLVNYTSITGYFYQPSREEIGVWSFPNAEDFKEKAMPFIKKGVQGECDFDLLCSVLQKRCDVLGDLTEQVDFIDEMPEYEIDLYTNKKMKTNPENSKEMLGHILPVLEGIEEWTMDNIHNKLFELIGQLGVKNGLVLYPLRVAVSGKQFTPGGGVELAAIMGKEKTIARVKAAIEKLA